MPLHTHGHAAGSYLRDASTRFLGHALCKTRFFAKLIPQAPEQAPHQHPTFEGPIWQNAIFCGGCLGSCTLEKKKDDFFSF